MTILDQEAPGLSQQLRELSSDQRRLVIVKACRSVSRSIKSLEAAFEVLLSAAAANNALSPAQIAEVRDYADAADERYFELEEQGADSGVWREWFAKARLATALADAFDGTSWEAAADAVYELCFVEEDKS